MTPQLHTLENGLRVVTEPMPGLQSASIGIWGNAGGRHERPEQNGIARIDLVGERDTSLYPCRIDQRVGPGVAVIVRTDLRQRVRCGPAGRGGPAME